MKKLFLLLICMVSAFPAFSQGRFEPEIKINGEVGTDADKNFSFGGIFIAGYNITTNFRLGIGTGVSYIDLLYETKTLTKTEYRETAAYIPLFADAKYKFIDKGISPYIGMSIGYSFFVPYSDYAKKNKLSFMANPHVGVEFPMGKGALILEAGYKYQVRTNDYFVNSNMNYSQATIAIGYKF